MSIMRPKEAGDAVKTKAFGGTSNTETRDKPREKNIRNFLS